MYLLDSDVIIDFLKGKEPIYGIIQKVSHERCYISVISWMEVNYGIEKVGSIKEKKEFQDFLDKLKVKILSIDERVGGIFIEKKISLENKGIRIADFDLIIASTAIAYNLILVTRNKRHFSRIKEVRLYNDK